MQNHTRLLLVALVVLAVLLVPAGTAIAQDAAGTQNETQAQNQTDTTQTPGGATGNATGNESENESAGLAERVGSRVSGFSLSMYEAENPVCEDMNAASAFTCDSVIGLLLAGGEAIQEFYVDVQIELISLIVDRPGAMQDGEMSVYGTPDNQPMTAVHTYWLDKTLPASLTLWAIIMVVNMLSGIMPFGPNSRYGQARAFETGVLCFFGIIMSWFLGNMILHAVFGLNMLVAPGPETLSTDPQIVQADTAAAVIGALAIYCGFGIAALLALAMFAVTWLGLYFLLPALPVAMLFKQPKVMILRRVNKYGDKVIDLFLICALWPLPAAIILGVGYPATAAIAEASPDFLAFIPGVAGGMAATLGLLRLGVWIAALFAPPFIFMLSSPTSAAVGGLGALGGYSLGAASGGAAGAATGAASGTASGSASALSSGAASASALPAGASSAASTIGTDPIKGTSLSADADSVVSASALPSGSGSLASAGQSSSVARAAASDAASSGTATGASAGDTSALPGGGDAGSTSDYSDGVTTLTDRSEFDASKQYEFGYKKDSGEFQVIENHTMSGEALVDRGHGVRIREAYEANGDDMLLRDPDSGELMDVSEIAARDRDYDAQLSPDVQSQQSRDTVFGTRDETPN